MRMNTMNALPTGFALLTLLLSPPAMALGLKEAWQQALLHDPEYQSARFASDAGQQEAAIGRAALLPALSWDYQHSRNDSEISREQRHSNQRYDSHAATLSLRQPLLDYEKWARYQRGKASGKEADAQLRDKYQQLMVRLFRAYSNVLFNQQQRQLVTVQQQVLAEQYQLNQRLFQAGEGTRTDILETEAKLNLINAQAIDVQNDLDISLQAFGEITGTVPNARELVPLSTTFVARSLQQQDFTQWLARALKNNALLLAQDQALAAARYDIERQRAGHFPRAALVASHRNSVSDGETSINQRYNTNSIGIQISVPLFAGGGVMAATRQAQARYQQALKEKDKQVAAVQTELRRRFNLLNSASAKIGAYQMAERSALALIDATRKSIQGGERINLDELNARQQLYVVRRELSQARYGWLTAWLELRYYAGVIDESSLFELATHFQRR